jgi:hypothetical protein
MLSVGFGLRAAGSDRFEDIPEAWSLQPVAVTAKNS